MSDFLTNLAARALHAPPVVQPRVASRFEAAQTSQRFHFDDTPGTQADLFHESTVPAAPPATKAHFEPHDLARARRNDSETSPLQSLSSLEQLAANALHRALTPRETHAENTSPITSLSAREQPVAKEIPRGLSPEESHIATASPIVVKTVIERPAPVDAVPGYDARKPLDSPVLDQSNVSRDDAENASERRSNRDTFGIDPRPVPVSPLRSEPPSHLAARIKTSGPLVATPQLTPALAPTPSQNLDPPAAAPTIRVTIGRVEVRAILPPEPSSPRATPARASSVLSLDEYLKRRTEGRA